MPPLITVITAVRNQVLSIGNTITSVLLQDHPALEYIVIDGASIDGTVDVLRSFGSAISKFTSEPDGGISDAFNKGVAMASGDGIIFMNAGDRFEDKSSVSKLVASRSPSDIRRSIIYGDARIVSPEGETLNIVSANHEGLGSNGLVPICHQSALIGIDLQRRFPYDTRIGTKMDFDFWMKCRSSGATFIRVNEITSRYLSGGRSMDPRFAIANNIESAIVLLLNCPERRQPSGLAQLTLDALRISMKYHLQIRIGNRPYRLLKLVTGRG